MKAKFYSLGILAVLAISASALAAADGFTIARKVKKDDLQKYTLKADADLNGMQAQIAATWTEKVTDVATDGSYTIQHTQVELKVNAGGQEVDVPGGDPLVTIFKPSGEVSKIVGDNSVATANSYRMANLEVVCDPGKPLNVGDTWTHEFPADTTTGATKAVGTYKLLGEEKIGAYDTLKIQVSIKEAGAAGAKDADLADNEGTVWIDKTDGSLVKGTMKWTNAPIPGSPVPINATVEITRV